MTAQTDSQPPIVAPTSPDDLLDLAWGLIANASEGDWDREHPDWKAAAERWRDLWHARLDAQRKPTVAGEGPRPVAPREPWTFTRREGEPLTVAEAAQQAVGGASACWEHLRRAGVFDSDRAKEISDALIVEIGNIRARDANALLSSVDPSGAVAELVEAIRLTVEYLGTETLPPVDGWSWYDALRKYAPHLAEGFVEQRRRAGAAQVTPAAATWDPATVTDPIEDMRAMAARIRSGDLPDRSEMLAAETAGLERLAAAVIAAREFTPVWAYGPVDGASARAMLWYAVEILAGVPDVEELLREVAADHAQRFAQRAAGARQAAAVLGPSALARMHDQQEQLMAEQLGDERAAVQLMTVVREIAGMSPATRTERQLLEDAAVASGSEDARLAAVREVADYFGAQRGRGDDGKVYADVAELRLRTALGEHSPDGPCRCPACPAVTRSPSGAMQEA